MWYDKSRIDSWLMKIFLPAITWSWRVYIHYRHNYRIWVCVKRWQGAVSDVIEKCTRVLEGELTGTACVISAGILSLCLAHCSYSLVNRLHIQTERQPFVIFAAEHLFQKKIDQKMSCLPLGYIQSCLQSFKIETLTFFTGLKEDISLLFDELLDLITPPEIKEYEDQEEQL